MPARWNQEFKYNENVIFIRAILDYALTAPPSSRTQGENYEILARILPAARRCRDKLRNVLMRNALQHFFVATPAASEED